MRWIALLTCFAVPMASNAWEKVAEVDEGIIFSGELVNLGRQSLAREIEVRLPRLSESVSQFRIRPSSFFFGGVEQCARV